MILDTHRDIDYWEAFMKHAVETGSRFLIYITNFIKTGSDFKKSIKEIHIYRQHGDRISFFFIFPKYGNYNKIHSQ